MTASVSTQQLVPTPTGVGDAFSSQTTSLDGTPYTLDFAFNQRAACWYLTISTLDGTLVIAGVKLVCDWDLLGKCVSPLRPPGRLFVLSNTTDTSVPGLTDLAAGGRCVLIYTPADRAAILVAGGTP